MSGLLDEIKSASRLAGGEEVVERVCIGDPGEPTKLIIYHGKIYVYNSIGQTLIDGGYITTEGLSALIVTTDKLVIGNKRYAEDIVWTPDDENTCSWSAGVIVFADGTITSINAGTTGDLTEKNYIYFDETSTLKKTPHESTAQSSTNIPLVIVDPVAVGTGKCNVYPFIPKGTTIDGDVVTTGRISSANGKTYFDLDNGVIVVNDTTNDQVITGKIGSSYGIKVALPGYDAGTETELDNFALWSVADDTYDNVLIKEKTRGSTSVPATDYVEIAHGLAYIPFVLVFVEETTGVYTKSYGQPISTYDSPTFPSVYFTIGNTYLTLWNNTDSAKTFKYYIFYDQIS